MTSRHYILYYHIAATLGMNFYMKVETNVLSDCQEWCSILGK